MPRGNGQSSCRRRTPFRSWWRTGAGVIGGHGERYGERSLRSCLQPIKRVHDLGSRLSPTPGNITAVGIGSSGGKPYSRLR
jgi:hypothetical protein